MHFLEVELVSDPGFLGGVLVGGGEREDAFWATTKKHS